MAGLLLSPTPGGTPGGERGEQQALPAFAEPVGELSQQLSFVIWGTWKLT
jgi:hypothetical protein